MKERPIIFNGEMVRAILDRRKTQTRRPVRRQLFVGGDFTSWSKEAREAVIRNHCPYGEVGDRLWVRETWHVCGGRSSDNCILIVYKADGDYSQRDDGTCIYCDEPQKWRPSIHMPRWASRITLEIVSRRVDGLQEIGEDDACAEGFKASSISGSLDSPEGWTSGVDLFAKCWDTIYKKRGYGWDVNPLVWVVEFKVIEPEGGAE